MSCPTATWSVSKLTTDDRRPSTHNPPAMKEDKVNSTPGNSSHKRQFRLVVVIGIAVLLLIAMIAVGVGFSIQRKGQTPKTTAAQSSTPDSIAPSADHIRQVRMDTVLDFVQQHGWSNRQDLSRQSSPQWKAAAWMADAAAAASQDSSRIQVPLEDTSYYRERYALVTFYYALKGPAWRFDMGWLTDLDVCDWGRDVSGKTTPLIRVGIDCECQAGIACYPNTVKRLYLPTFQLAGTIPNEIGLLTDLEIFDLHGNSVTGSIPVTFEKLTGLRKLILSNNGLTGGLPSWLGSLKQLDNLNLGSNQMDGEIPSVNAKMENLVVLNLRQNGLHGNINSLEGHEKLEAIFLDGNRLEGQITNDLLDSWPNLVVLDVSGNWLDGPLPSGLVTSSTLKIVDVHGNQFSESFPDCPQENNVLKFLDIHNNTLDGPIHPDVRNLIKLKHLGISDNRFTGDIPEEIASLFHLEYMFLGPNPKLNPGPIPTVLANIGSLRGISLKDTNRNGLIPNRFGDLDNLVLFDVADNQLTGSIPDTFGYANRLKFLFLNNNRLQGEIPDSFVQLTSLDTLFLDRNTIYGSTDKICEAQIGFSNFVTDCGLTPNGDQVVFCPCCTICCHDDQPDCYHMERMGAPDPIWEQERVRAPYDLDEDDIVFPSS
jgi:Leucine-rich repeat (LRR) protein